MTDKVHTLRRDQSGELPRPAKLESWEENRAALKVALGGTNQDAILDVLHAIADDANYDVSHPARGAYIIGYLTSFICSENREAALDAGFSIDTKIATVDELKRRIRPQAE